jgi:RNA ligase (TIGR02306 family)
MSSFAVQIRKVEVSPHPDADRLDLVKVDDYTAVSQKGRFQSGDLAVYVPEQAVLNEKLLKLSGFWNEEQGKGMLAGSKGDRVKPVRLRGVISQGILLDVDLLNSPEGEVTVGDAAEGMEVGHLLDIKKWEPPIPVHLAGDVKPNADIRGYTDIENIKRYPDVLVDGEEVVATEKMHGSCCIVMWHDGDLFVSSKGMASKGLVIEDKQDEQGRSTNAYWRAANELHLRERLRLLAEYLMVDKIILYGELLGVQDLKYGEGNGSVGFVAFDIYFNDRYADYDYFLQLMEWEDIPPARELYRGPYSKEAILAVTDGKETITGDEMHVREGVVVKPVHDRRDDTMGRVVLKSVSADYLTRRDATEFN